MYYKVLTFIVLIILFFLNGCTLQPGQKEFIELRKIPHKNTQEIENKLSQHPIEKQIDIYLFSECCVRGNSYDLMRYLAVNGKANIPHLVKRINTSEHAIDKTNLMLAVKFIDLNCECVTADLKTMQILEKNVMKANDDDIEGIKIYKTLYKTSLNDLKDRRTKRNVEKKEGQ